MKFVVPLSMAALVGLSTSTPVQVNKRASPLTIELKSVGNSAVKAILTNTGAEDLKLLKTGTILDDKPTEKVQVYNANGKLPFNGMKLRVSTTNLDEDAFLPLAAGQSKELDIEVASLHDLTEGGDFDLFSQGALPYALGNSTLLEGSALPFTASKLSIKVDGTLAARVAPAIKRSVVQNDCTGTQLTAAKLALDNCAKLATAAAASAQTGGTLFKEYFKTASKDTVVARLKAVATECGSTTSGKTKSSCTDSQNGCSSGVLAYTLPSTGLVVNCPLYYNDLPALSTRCHEQDQATTTLHEMTHANAVFSPGTDDLGYGYSAATALSANSALNNADSYALFANAVKVGCTGKNGSPLTEEAPSSVPETPASSSVAASSVPASSATPAPTRTPTATPSSVPSFTLSPPSSASAPSVPTNIPTAKPSATGRPSGSPTKPSASGTPSLPTNLPAMPSDGASFQEWLEWLQGLFGSRGARRHQAQAHQYHQ